MDYSGGGGGGGEGKGYVGSPLQNYWGGGGGLAQPLPMPMKCKLHWVASKVHMSPLWSSFNLHVTQ